ncbi:hypothetical protein C2U71_07260 [Burkholderia ubonensis]|nr:hypothetical protein A8H33_02400 [Burkholderia vietnamiensis]AXK68061.1 hypothetical protein DCN14_36155 [Burkholderia sp. IDO3]TPQ46732.1 hypothetical protein C2U71_07260 [Burkholderia ubonensis]
MVVRDYGAWYLSWLIHAAMIGLFMAAHGLLAATQQRRVVVRERLNVRMADPPGRAFSALCVIPPVHIEHANAHESLHCAPSCMLVP